MNDIQKRLMWDRIKREKCPYCKVPCHLKSLNTSDILKEGKKRQLRSVFELTEKYKSCYFYVV